MANRDLKLSYWYVSSKPKIRQAGYALLAFLDILLIAGTALYWAKYASGQSTHLALVASLTENRVQYEQALANVQPEELVVDQTAALKNIDGTYTLAAVAHNPAARWAVTSTEYQFIIHDTIVASGTTEFLQSSERFLTAFNVDLANIGAPTSVTVRFVQTKRIHVDASLDIPNVDFTVTNARYRVLSAIPGQVVSQVTADVRNSSVTSFASVNVTALLLQGSTIVGVGQLTVSDFAGLTSRSVDMRLFQALSVTMVRVIATTPVFTDR